MRANPSDYPHIEKVAGDLPMDADAKYKCTMYGGSFDYEAYKQEGGCPVCEYMSRAQEDIRGGL